MWPPALMALAPPPRAGLSPTRPHPVRGALPTGLIGGCRAGPYTRRTQPNGRREVTCEAHPHELLPPASSEQ